MLTVGCRVFVSSTYLDNQVRRERAIEAIERAGMVPVGMERFAASTRPSVEECRRLVQTCDVYLGIVAHRCGWIPTREEGGDGERSITEIEYDAASELPRLVLEIDPAQTLSHADFDQGPDRWKKQEKLEAFRGRYRASVMPGVFRDDNLGMLVLHTLQQWDKERSDPPSKLPVQTDLETTALRERGKQIHEALVSLVEARGDGTRASISRLAVHASGEGKLSQGVASAAKGVDLALRALDRDGLTRAEIEHNLQQAEIVLDLIRRAPQTLGS